MQHKHILFVDDEAIICHSFAREIELEGFSTATAGGGEEAITMLREASYDLVVTDLMMPGTDGFDVLQAAKEITPGISVIILTGHGDMGSAIEALRLGADDFLQKPCATDELLFRIDRCLEKQSLLQQLHSQNLQLKEEIRQREKVEKELAESEERFRLALDASSDGLWERNLQTNEEYYGEKWHQTLGFSDEEAKRLPCSWKDLLHPEDREKTFVVLQGHIEGKTPRYEAEFRMQNNKGAYQWILSRGKVVEWDEQGRPLRILGTHTDITRLKEVEAILKHAQADLEQKVMERTTELGEINIALKVLLQKREDDQISFEQRIFSNVTDLVEPYIAKLENSRLSGQQQVLLEILKSNINELTSSFVQNFSTRYAKLTPMETKVANLIRQGKMSKEIAEVMHLAPGTINIHRKNIRKKLALTHTKANLQSILASL